MFDFFLNPFGFHFIPPLVVSVYPVTRRPLGRSPGTENLRTLYLRDVEPMHQHQVHYLLTEQFAWQVPPQQVSAGLTISNRFVASSLSKTNPCDGYSYTSLRMVSSLTLLVWRRVPYSSAILMERRISATRSGSIWLTNGSNNPIASRESNLSGSPGCNL